MTVYNYVYAQNYSISGHLSPFFGGGSGGQGRDWRKKSPSFLARGKRAIT